MDGRVHIAIRDGPDLIPVVAKTSFLPGSEYLGLADGRDLATFELLQELQREDTVTVWCFPW